MKRGGLGRGLAALLPEASTERGFLEIPVSDIAPNARQPRMAFPEDSLAALARSIQEVGVLQPLVVRARRGGYELVAGERRLRAAKLAGLATVPGVLRDGSNTESLREALIENIHREDLGPLELAAAFQELVGELGGTADAVAERLGCSRAHVANAMRLLSLPADVQGLVAEGKILAGHARALLGLPDEAAMSALAVRVAGEGLSVREVEDLVRSYAARTLRRPRRERAADPSIAEAEEILSERLSTRVLVSMGRRRGRIVVEFASREDLERIVGEITASDVIRVPEAEAR